MLLNALLEKVTNKSGIAKVFVLVGHRIVHDTWKHCIKLPVTLVFIRLYKGKK